MRVNIDEIKDSGIERTWEMTREMLDVLGVKHVGE